MIKVNIGAVILKNIYGDKLSGNVVDINTLL